jgi:hypothetical protein
MKVQDMLAQRRIALDEFHQAVEHDVRYAIDEPRHRVEIRIITRPGQGEIALQVLLDRAAEHGLSSTPGPVDGRASCRPPRR